MSWLLDFLPFLWHADPMALTNVAALVPNGVAPFELGVLCEVFGIDRSDQGLPSYDFAVCGVEPGRVSTSIGGFSVVVEHGLERLADADLIGVPACGDGGWPEEVLQALRDAVDRGARVLSLCTGAFVLGAAGLLDGRDCTTHWRYAEQLQERYPRARVNPDVLYVDTGQVLTSAGTAAGIDLCLHVVRQEQGAAVANAIARRMVVPPHRDGGQAQYVETPVAVPQSADSLRPVLTWMQQNLHRDMPVSELARKAAMSPRTFARRFRAETGTTPHQWVTSQRLLLAERLLEETNAPIDTVASRTGFGNAAALRHHFSAARGTTPQAYRRTFNPV
jgi:transcriptional regulator GlxA family with amidase domain